MGNSMRKLHTDAKLIQALSKSAKHKQSAEERQKQRVSFVFGSLDSDSGVTRDRVSELVLKDLTCA